MQEIDAIQNKRESKIISSINNDTSENGYIVFDYREKSGYRNFDTQDWKRETRHKKPRDKWSLKKENIQESCSRYNHDSNERTKCSETTKDI